MSTPTLQESNAAGTSGASATHLDAKDGQEAMNQSTGAEIDSTADTIRQGKQKAKEAMAAAATGTETSATTPSQPSLPNGSSQTNGAPQLGRKRSRDGTLLPLSQAKPSDDDSDGAEQLSHDAILLDRYMQRDLLHGGALNDHAERTRVIVKGKEVEKEFYVTEIKHRRQTNPGSIFGHGYAGFGNRTTEGKTQIVYSTMRGPPKTRRNRELHIPRKDNALQAEHHEELVPLRIDVELDKLRLRDTFTWNLHERLISPDMFADYLLEDLRIPPEFAPEIAKQVKAEMHDQLHNYYPHIIVEDGPLEPGRPYFDHKEDEMRIMIRINITIGRITLVDQFEWDINNPQNSPEEFARQMAWENALSGEFTTAIAHSIREQSQLYTKSLFLTNHCFDGRPVEDPDLRDSLLPTPVYSAFRPQQLQKDWTPYMYEMSEAELERTETSMMREHRAQKRQLNRRGGPALPDLKDRQRTVRSLIIHSVIPGAVETFETTGIPKTRRSGRGGRRIPRNEGEIDSEDLDSEESGAESPAPSLLNNAGTARTRGMRGAASAAQAAMRANYGRSATPDSQLNAPQDLRSARRSMLRDDGGPDEDSLVVKLKIGKAKLKAWWDDYRAKKKASEYPLSGYASLPPPAATPSSATANRAAVATPTATPRPARNTPQLNGHNRTASSARTAAPQHDSAGRVDMASYPSSDDEAPPPPSWLTDAVTILQQRYKDSRLEGLMRFACVDATTGTTIPGKFSPGDAPPPGAKFIYAPRIRCLDCVGKIYSAIPGRVVEDFEVHLKNGRHVRNVAERKEREDEG